MNVYRLLVVMLLLVASFNAHAQAPRIVSYQGVLTDNAGLPLADGDYTLAFKIYDQESGGSPLWLETQNVTLSGGVFDAILGSTTPLALEFDTPYWITIAINAGPDMTPRAPLTTSPYSFRAHSVTDSSVVASSLANGAVVRSVEGLTDNVRVLGVGGIAVSTVGDTLVFDGGAAGTESPWLMNGNDVYYDAGRVGIGEPNPRAGLNVAEGLDVVFGADTSGAGSRVQWWSDLGAFRAGRVSTGATSAYWDEDSTGTYSIAMGLNSRAQGLAGVSLGRDTEAQGDYSFASGYFTDANGTYSTAMGYNTDAERVGATATGYNTEALGQFSFAAGFGTRAAARSSIALGRYNVGLGSPDTDQETDVIFEVGVGTSDSARQNAIAVRKNGRVGIGVFPQSTLHVVDEIRIGSIETIRDVGNRILHVGASVRPDLDDAYALGTGSSRWTTVYASNGTINTSDARLKQDIEPIAYGLNEVMKLRPVSFRWKDDQFGNTKLGLVAQEVQPIISEVVVSEELSRASEDPADKQLVRKPAENLGMYYSDLIPVLIKAIQDQQKIITDQKAAIERLDARLKALEKN